MVCQILFSRQNREQIFQCRLLLSMHSVKHLIFAIK